MSYKTFRTSHTLRLFIEAVCVGLIVGLAIIWWQGGLGRHSGVVSYAKAVNRAVPAVVNVYTTRQASAPQSNNPLRFFFQPPHRNRLEASLGSGVIVSKKGYILTSYHVIEGADAILVALADGREAEATIVGRDPATDLALLKINLEHLPVIDLDKRGPVRVGDVVLAIGNPLGIGQTVTMGIVGATGRSHLGLATFENFIQTDAAINKGNSGGALVDTNGDLVGINTAILSSDGRWQGIGFATPAPVAEEVMRDLITYGHVIRGYLGVSVQNLTPQLAGKLGLNDTRGALITGVMQGSPADTAGLRPGDLLLGINNKPISDGYNAMNEVADSKPGSKLTFNILHNGQPLSVAITIGERPAGMDYQN
jgi:serine protease DegS